MKKYLSIFGIMLMTLFSMTSCLEHGLEDLDAFEECRITAWPAVYYRYYTGDQMAVNGQQQVKQIQLTRKAGSNDYDEGDTFFELTVAPDNVPADEKPNVKLDNLVVTISVSTGATVEPIEGAPRLGVPGDWSKPNKYKITAADGKHTNVQTITVKLQ